MRGIEEERGLTVRFLIYPHQKMAAHVPAMRNTAATVASDHKTIFLDMLIFLLPF